MVTIITREREHRAQEARGASRHLPGGRRSGKAGQPVQAPRQWSPKGDHNRGRTDREKTMSEKDRRSETEMMELWIPGSDPVNHAHVPREDRMLAMSEEAAEHQGNTVSAYFAIRNSVCRNLIVRETPDRLADGKTKALAVIRKIGVTAVHEAGSEQIEAARQYSGRKPKRINVVLRIEELDGSARKVKLTTPVGFTTPEWIALGTIERSPFSSWTRSPASTSCPRRSPVERREPARDGGRRTRRRRRVRGRAGLLPCRLRRAERRGDVGQVEDREEDAEALDDAGAQLRVDGEPGGSTSASTSAIFRSIRSGSSVER